MLAKEECVKLLRTDIDSWNEYREKNSSWVPDLTEVRLSEINTIDAHLLEKELNELNLIGANQNRADLSRAKQIKNKMWWAELTSIYQEGVDLIEANLSSANLSGANLGGAYLGRANFMDANLSGSNLSEAFLFDANLIRANLSRANFMDAALIGANLNGANLNEACLMGADLRGANLKGANLSRANLSDVDLSDADLSDANLENILVVDRDGSTKTNFTNTIFKNTRFPTEGNYYSATSFLDLACIDTLVKADFKNPADLTIYLSKAFEYSHKEDIPEKESYPGLVNTAIERIKTLRQLYQGNDSPDLVIKEIKPIAAEVLAYLKKNPKKIYKIGSRQFEELIAEILAGFGWDVKLTPKSKDGGYDLFAINKTVGGLETSWLIECKRYREDRPVGIDIARSLYGVKYDLKVANALLATTSHFTKGVQEFKASRYDLQLADYEGILEWINTYQPHPDGQWYVDGKSGLVLPR